MKNENIKFYVVTFYAAYSVPMSDSNSMFQLLLDFHNFFLFHLLQLVHFIVILLHIRRPDDNDISRRFALS